MESKHNVVDDEMMGPTVSPKFYSRDQLIAEQKISSGGQLTDVPNRSQGSTQDNERRQYDDQVEGQEKKPSIFDRFLPRGHRKNPEYPRK